MGFRSYVRQFWGAIFMLLRPSLPWCFPIRQLSFEQKEQQQQQQDEKVAFSHPAAAAAAGRKSS